MLRILRKTAFAFPFGCLVALAVHCVRFGDDHAFGGDGNDALVTAALGGSAAIALAILHAFLTAGTTLTTGTLARVRARALLPHGAAVFALAAGIYYGIESLEGHGIEFGLPVLLLALGAAAVANALRAVTAQFARFVCDVARDWCARLDARRCIVRHLEAHPQPVHAEPLLAARLFGRAPPVLRTL